MRTLLLLACLVLPLVGSEPATLPLLSPVFGEHMVLQRGKPNPIWGWAEPGTQVTVAFAGQEKTVTTDAQGKWLVALDALEASVDARDLVVTSTNRKSEIVNRKLTDVLVGDVWLCGGQSNMEFDLARSRDGAAAVQQSTHESIRLFRVATQPGYAAALTPRGEWRRCEPAAFAQPGGFSAVAYYFARKIQAETGVPIGLVQVAVGGTPAESWMSPAALEAFPEFAPGLTEMARLRERGAPAYGNFVMHWYDEFDRGIAGKWSEAGFDDGAWTPASLHDAFTKLGVPATPAVAWMRRDVELPDPLPAGAAKLLLGVVEKMDTAWINGRWIGASAWVENPRAYTIPADALRPGRNQLTLRVLKTAADGGFRSPAEALKLVLGDGTVIPLENSWRAALGADARPPHPLPLGYENWPTMPAVLHLGMLRPLAPLAVAGALWYQGEANFTRARQYRTLLPAMIADWRTLFAAPDLPLYLVSLPAFMARRDQPGSDAWTELREAQEFTARTVPHTALAITIDTGDANDIHPADKQPVGERLALLALRHTYGRADVVADGPYFARMEPAPGGLRLFFANTNGGLVARGPLAGFAIAGRDRVWHWAEARLEGETVVVSSPAVPEPVAIRYAWQANPPAPLFNGAGLPAAPFRTDDW
jgi:sialate O-acetylesterase